MAETEKDYLNSVDFIIMEDNADNVITNEAEVSDSEIDDQPQSSKMSTTAIPLNEKCHTLVIRQTTNLHKTERIFFCMECKKDFQTMKAFSEAHELLDNNEADNIVVVDENSDSVQWDVVDNELEIKPEDFDEITEEKYQLSEYNVINYENDYDEIDDDDDDNNDENVNSKQQHKNDKIYDENAEITFDPLDEEEKVEEEEEEEEEEDEDDEDVDDNYKSKFFCTVCETIFNEYAAAENHDCTALNKSINKKNIKSKAKEIEVEQIEDPQRYICGNCGLNLNTLDNLEKHFHKCTLNNTVANKNVFLCDKCPKKFTSISGFSNHAKTHTVKSKKKTAIATHSNLQNADINVKIKSNNLNLKSGKKKTSKSKTKNAKNLNVTSGEESELYAKCDICNTEFENLRSLRLHAKMHKAARVKSIEDALPAAAKYQYSELNQFYCEICQKSFNENLLEIHKNMHRNLEEYTCKICNRQFENLPSYEVHVQMHTEKAKKKPIKERKQQNLRADGVKLPYKCQYCGYAFQRPFEKVKHERIHTGEKPYECEVCGKKFRVSYSLTLHLRSHTNIRPFVCATCKKRFKSKPAYEHHLNTHRPERLYKCDICTKTFHTSVQLCAHKNSHDKPFNCPECNRPYASLFSVKVHMKTHIKSNKSNVNLKYRCAVCGAVYARTSALRVHLHEMHRVDKDACNQAMELRYIQDLSMLPNENNNSDDSNNVTGLSEEKEEDFEASMQKIIESCCNEKDIDENEEIKVDDNVQCEEVVY